MRRPIATAALASLVATPECERYEIGEGDEDFEIDLISANLGYRF